MALSHGLAEASNPPSPLETDVHSIFEQTDAGFGITSMAITVGGEVPGIDQAAFAGAATAASEDCPVSQAVSGNVDITLSATLLRQNVRPRSPAPAGDLAIV